MTFLQKFVLLIFILLVFFTESKGQSKNNSSDTVAKFNADYIKDYSNLLNIYLYGKIKYDRFNMRDKESGKTIKYSPNDQLNLGFGFLYKWLGVGIAINFPFINHDNDKYGKTTRLDCQTNMYLQSFVIDAYYLYYKGYYIENPKELFTDWNPDTSYIRPDIKTNSLGASVIYVFNNKKFSYQASFYCNRLQKKSAGSLLLGPIFSFYKMQADSSIVPYSIRDDFSENFDLQKTSILNFGITFGYAYTFVILKHIFLTASLTPSVMYKNYNLKPESQKEYKSSSHLSLGLQIRCALGYNGKKNFFGITYIDNDFLDEYYRNENIPGFKYNIGNIRFFYGRRFNFNPPRFLDKLF